VLTCNQHTCRASKASGGGSEIDFFLAHAAISQASGDCTRDLGTGARPHHGVCITLFDGRRHEEVTVLKPVKCGELQITGPMPEAPQEWAPFYEQCRNVWNAGGSQDEEADALGARWEVIAHSEAIPRFKREKTGGGKAGNQDPNS
jgi:hypothetical protein